MGFFGPVFHCGCLLYLALFLLFCSSEAEVVTVDVNAAKGLLASGYRYLDVRTAEEYKRGHVDVGNILNIAYSFNTPEGRVKNPEFLEHVSSACSKEDRFVVGCHSGVRSLYASTDLLGAGFKHVYNMGGGYAAWVESGFSATKPEVEKKAEAEKSGAWNMCSVHSDGIACAPRLSE